MQPTAVIVFRDRYIKLVTAMHILVKQISKLFVDKPSTFEGELYRFQDIYKNLVKTLTGRQCNVSDMLDMLGESI